MSFGSSEHIDKSELCPLENQLRKKALIHRKDVQNLLQQASLSRNTRIYASIINRLWHIIEAYDEEAMRTADPFMPYCPLSKSVSGDLHLITQMDNTKIFVDPDTLVTGVLIIGPVGSGKTLFLVHLCEELSRIQP